MHVEGMLGVVKYNLHKSLSLDIHIYMCVCARKNSLQIPYNILTLLVLFCPGAVFIPFGGPPRDRIQSFVAPLRTEVAARSSAR